MNRHELQKPLLQSALVLLAILILIGFIAGSGAESFLGGIVSIFKGIFLTLLFAIGLVIALIFSVVVLFAIFLGAIAIYSPETSRDMFYALRTRTTELLSPWLSRLPASRAGLKKSTVQAEKTPETATREDIPAPTKRQRDQDTTELLNKTRAELQSEIDNIGKDISHLSRENQSLSDSLSHLEETCNQVVADQIVSTTSKLESRQDELAASLSDCIQKLDQINSSLHDSDKRIKQQEIQLKDANEKITLLSAEIAELRTTPAPQAEKEVEAHDEAVEEEFRIFSYLEKESDKKQFAELIEKAVEKDMTYTEIDEFLSQSLSKKIDTIIKEHPVLTKEYIRERRQKK